MRKVVIHQTQYLPYIGLFSKLMTADKFIFLDTVYFSSGAFINRNKILTPNGPCWITVPITLKDSLKTEIRNVETVENVIWKKKHLKMLENSYGRHPYFQDVFPLYKQALCSSDSFQEICMSILQVFCKYLGLNVDFCTSSSFSGSSPVEESKTARLLRLTEEVDCDVYVGGEGSLTYCTEEDYMQFRRAGKKFEIQTYVAEPYQQYGWKGEFVPNLSIFDLLCNMSVEDCRGYLVTQSRIIR